MPKRKQPHKKTRPTSPRADSEPKTPAKEPKPRRQWKPAFLLAFAASGNVLRSCVEAGIDRGTAYKAYQSDGEFREAWKNAQEDAAEILEHRAEQNLEWEEPVMYEGQVVFVWVDAEGKFVEPPDEEEGQSEPVGAKRVPLTLRKHDPALFSLLLKARNPGRFRENVKVQHTGPGGGPIKHEGKTTQSFDYDQLASALEKHAAGAAARRVRPDGNP